MFFSAGQAPEQFDEPLRGIIAQIVAHQVPPEHTVYFASPGNWISYIRAALFTVFFGCLAVLAVALLIGGGLAVVGGVANSPETFAVGVAILTVAGFSLFYVPFLIIPTLLIGWRHRTMVKSPGRQAIAVGPWGVITTGFSAFGVRCSVTPWPQTAPWRLSRGMNALGQMIRMGPDFFSAAFAENYDAPLSVIFQAIKAGGRLASMGHRVTGESIAGQVAPERHPRFVIGQPLPLILSGPAPEPIPRLVADIARLEPPDGARVHLWNRSWRSLGKIALLVAASCLLILPAMFVGIVFMLAVYLRGKKERWFVAFLPEGLLLNIGNGGVQCIGWEHLRSVEVDGRDAVIKTDVGALVLECEFYGMTAEAFQARCTQLVERRASLR